MKLSVGGLVTAHPAVVGVLFEWERAGMAQHLIIRLEDARQLLAELERMVALGNSMREALEREGSEPS